MNLVAAVDKLSDVLEDFPRCLSHADAQALSVRLTNTLIREAQRSLHSDVCTGEARIECERNLRDHLGAAHPVSCLEGSDPRAVAAHLLQLLGASPTEDDELPSPQLGPTQASPDHIKTSQGIAGKEDLLAKLSTVSETARPTGFHPFGIQLPLTKASDEARDLVRGELRGEPLWDSKEQAKGKVCSEAGCRVGNVVRTKTMGEPRTEVVSDVKSEARGKARGEASAEATSLTSKSVLQPVAAVLSESQMLHRPEQGLSKRTQSQLAQRHERKAMSKSEGATPPAKKPAGARQKCRALKPIKDQASIVRFFASK